MTTKKTLEKNTSIKNSSKKKTIVKKVGEKKLGFKRCSYCGNEIKATARKCQYCGKWFQKSSTRERTEYDETIDLTSRKIEYKENSFTSFVTGTNLNRIGRIKYIARSGILVLIFLIMLGLGGYLRTSGVDYRMWIVLMPTLLIFILNVFLNNKRLHDRGILGWWQLLMLIPIVNVIVVLYLCFSPGNKGENKYGEPSDNKIREKCLTIIRVFVFFLILIGNIKYSYI